jgi:hypothetical protein
MLIVSKHLDYYDGLSKQYLDRSIVYNRTKEDIQNSKIGYGSELGKLLNIYKDIPMTGDYYTKLKKYENFMEPILIGFCGEFYLGYRCHLITDIQESYLYNQIDVMDKHTQLKNQWNDRYLYGFEGKKIVNSFLEIRKYKNDDIFIELGCPVFTIRLDRYSNINPFVITKNPILKDIGFQKVKDIFTCFQDIQTFLSNVLVKKEVDTIISDIDLLHSKGYDKYSFRKEKK